MATWAEPEGFAKEALKADSVIMTLTDGRVFFGLPAKTIMPCIVVTLIDDAPEQEEAPVSLATLQYDVWADKKQEAAELSLLLVNHIESLLGIATNKARCVYAAVSSRLWLPEPNSGSARYSVTADIALTAQVASSTDAEAAMSVALT